MRTPLHVTGRLGVLSTLTLLTVGLLSGLAPVLAAERTLTLADYTGRGFPPDLVHYTVPAAGAARLRLVGEDGTGVPVQVHPRDAQTATLSFVTALPANATVRYTVRDDGSAPPATDVRATRDGETMILANSLLSLRVPAPMEKSFATPVAASTLPAPILAFKSGSSAWLGAGTMLCTRPVTALRVTQQATGPVYLVLRYELTLANGGFYRATIQIIDRVPVAKITEEYDAKALSGQDYWALNLTTGWTPDAVEVASTAGNGQVDPGKVIPLAKLGATPTPITAPWVLIPDSAWGPRSQLGLLSTTVEKNPLPGAPLSPLVGFIPLHKGDWRRMTGVEIHTPDSQAITLCFPMSVRHASWLTDVTSESSPFSMQEHDPSLPATYGRRVWGLMLGTPPMTCRGENGAAIGPFYQARLLYGVVGLDRYKDFRLQWPDTGVRYPREFLRAADLEKTKAALDQSPLGDVLKAKWYSLNGDVKVAQARLTEAKKRLTWLANFMVSSPTIGHHAMAGNALIAAAADDALAWREMPAVDRAELRARLALVTYLYEEPDVISYGDGAHSGNPNMGVARSMAMNNFLALLPDHPMFLAWRAHMAAYTAYKVGSMMAPGGGWFEYGGAYHMHGYARVTNALVGLEAAGAPNLEALYAYHAPDWDYYLNLLTPYDTRWFARMEPGMANSPPSYTEHFLEAAGTLATRNPELAANLKWAWEHNGRHRMEDPVNSMNGILDPPTLAAKEPNLTSRIFPGIGVIFRAHQGPDETYMFLRSGNNWSHWPEDQGQFILSSKGAVLCPSQPYQYWTSPKKDFDMASLLRFGDPTNRLPHSWPDSNILDHAFGPTVDYAWSSTGFPDWYIAPGAVEAYKPKSDVPVASGMLRALAPGIAQAQGAFAWNRQVLFLKGDTAKSPNYFVFRDTVRGEGKLASWFNLNLLGRQKDVQIDGGHIAVDTEWPTKLDLLFVQPGKVSADFYEETQPGPAFAPFHQPWYRAMKTAPAPISPNWVRTDGKPVKFPEAPPTHEQHVFLRIANAPGAEFTWLVYPRGAGEALPTVTHLAPGALKIVTSEGTDYVFLSPTPITYAGAGVTFAGCSGAVRVKKQTVTLALTGGTGSVGFQGYVLSSDTPVERTLERRKMKKTMVAAPTPKTTITYPPGLAGAQPLVPGVTKATAGGETEYVLASPTLVTAADGAVRLEGRLGAIRCTPQGIRFVVTTRDYAQLSVGNVGVRGVGPFDLTFTATGITGRVDGDIRTLVVTWPDQIVRPMFHLDGMRYFAGWADDHCIAKGTPTPQFAIGFGVTAGPHTVAIAEWSYPALPPVPTRAAVE
jgi:hypothetical protein